MMSTRKLPSGYRNKRPESQLIHTQFGIAARKIANFFIHIIICGNDSSDDDCSSGSGIMLKVAMTLGKKKERTNIHRLVPRL